MVCRDCLHNEMCYATHTDDSPTCCDFKDRSKYVLKGEPKTVGDRIRSMNDTNLANFLSAIADKGETPWSKPFEERICRVCPTNSFDDCKCPPGVGIAWWLKLPVDSISANDAP